MNHVEFEDLVRTAVNRVLSGGRLEDTRFEAKARVPDIEQFAERLAGHANAAGGQPIIWVFGLDEDACRITTDWAVDMADLMPRAARYFDQSEAPEPIRDHRFTFEGYGDVLAVEFDTSYPPYVVNRGTGDDWTYAIPWRSLTRLRAARREELRRLLVRQTQVPSVRHIFVRLQLGEDTAHLSGSLLFGVTPWAPPVFLPKRDIMITILSRSTSTQFDAHWGDLQATGDRVLSMGWQRDEGPEGSYPTRSGLMIQNAGSIPFDSAVDLEAHFDKDTLKRLRGTKNLRFRFEARVLDSESIVGYETQLKRQADSSGKYVWVSD